MKTFKYYFCRSLPTKVNIDITHRNQINLELKSNELIQMFLDRYRLLSDLHISLQRPPQRIAVKKVVVVVAIMEANCKCRSHVEGRCCVEVVVVLDWFEHTVKQLFMSAIN